MTKILFVCHGNICRSPMAEFVMKDLIKKAGLSDEYFIASAATSTEEIGNPPHRGTANKLREVGIPLVPHRAKQISFADYNDFDYFIGMDEIHDIPPSHHHKLHQNYRCTMDLRYPGRTRQKKEICILCHPDHHAACGEDT